MTTPPLLAISGRALAVLTIALALGAGCDDEGNTSADAGPDGSARGPVELVELDGIDISKLTDREKKEWSRHVGSMLAPCPDVAVPLAQCVKEKRKCAQCVPAAEFLVRQVRSGNPKEQIQTAFADRFDPKQVKKLDVGDSPATGPANAPITIIEFADFECGACALAYLQLQPVKKRFGEQLRFVFKHFPLVDHHPHAQLAAQAGVAGHKQDRFWGMHNLMFDNQMALTESDLLGYADRAGLDVAQFRRDLHDPATVQRVAADKKAGATVAVEGTPTLFINGRRCNFALFGEDPIGELEKWLEMELELAGVKLPPPLPKAPTPPPPGSGASSSASSASVTPPAAGTGAPRATGKP